MAVTQPTKFVKVGVALTRQTRCHLTQLLDLDVSIVTRARTVLEQLLGAFQHPLFPVLNLVRMHIEMLYKFRQGPVPLQRCQRHLRFETRGMVSTFSLHLLPPVDYLTLSQKISLTIPSQLSKGWGPLLKDELKVTRKIIRIPHTQYLTITRFVYVKYGVPLQGALVNSQ